MKLLLGVSGDDRSMRALERTVERASEAGDALTVAVVERAGDERSPEAVRRDVREYLEEAGVDAEVRVLQGDPGSRLVELAEDGDYDRLVIPGGAESPLGKIDLDHTEQYVLLNCRTTVTIVR